MSSSCVLRVAVLALGTRGDVQPLALLAAALQQHTGAITTLVTHEQHRVWLEELLPQLPVLGCCMLPAAVWGAQQESSRTAADQLEQQLQVCHLCCSALGTPLPGVDAAGSQQAIQHDQDVEQRSAKTSNQQQQQQQQPQQQEQPQHLQQHDCLLVFNLFALEGYHLAEALGSACAAAHPYVIPYSMPAAFEQQFQQQEPALYQQLQAAVGNREGHVSWSEVRHWMWPLFTERWQLLRERLGLDAWPQLHQAAQQRQPKEGQQRRQQLQEQAHQRLGQQEQVEGVGAGAPASQQQALCHAWPLLYGCSQVVLPRPGHWPSSIHITGYWYTQHLHQAPDNYHVSSSSSNRECTLTRGALPRELESWLLQAAAGGVHAAAAAASGSELLASSRSTAAAAAAAAAGGGVAQDSMRASEAEATAQMQQHPGRCTGLVCVDFGSMGQLGLLPEPSHLLATLAGALEQLGWRGVLLSGGWAALEAAYDAWAAPDYTNRAGTASEPGIGEREGPEQRLQQRVLPASSHAAASQGHVLLLWRQPLLQHQQLLARCSVLWTHGGSGTVAAALAAATPLVITPLQFDQHFWAERVEYLGSGLVLPSSSLWGPSGAKPAMGGPGAAAPQLAAALRQAAQLDCGGLAEAVLAENGLQQALNLLSPTAGS